VGDVSEELEKQSRLAMHSWNLPFEKFVVILEPFVRYSTIHRYRCKLAKRLSQWDYPCNIMMFVWNQNTIESNYSTKSGAM